ncbi:MAG: peptidylprolyl isomerase [Rhodothermales bacterium]|nr:peptidylprolyl isomerase [Rhodothermales bacterium]
MKATLSATVPSAVLLAALFVYGCGTSDPILDPSFVTLNRAAPDSFDVEMTTSEGPVRLRFNRAWSPLGVDRAFYLFNNNFYEGARFYRVIDGFVAQFGGSGEVMVDSLWRELAINDEPVRAGNARGTIAFARAGPRSRSFTMYINLADNFRLDTLTAGGVRGYPPIGRVIDGMAVVDSLYGGYGARPMGTDLGARTLRYEYPQLDSIAATSIVRMY